MDGTTTSDNDRVLVVGATNRPQELDEAIRRRFVKRLYVPLPTQEARLSILNNLMEDMDHTLDTDDLLEVSGLTQGFSGADMDSLCREASMEPFRDIPSDQILRLQKENVICWKIVS